MSRHHIRRKVSERRQPKKIEKSRRRVRVGDLEETEAAAQTSEASAANQPPPPGSAKPGLLPIEGSEHKPHHPQGQRKHAERDVAGSGI